MRSVIMVVVLALSGCVTVAPTEREKGHIVAAKNAGATIFVEDVNVGPPNSAGGRKIGVTMVNVSGQRIKYINFWLDYFNRVGDPATCAYGAGSAGRYTGPVEPGERINIAFNSLCYDSPVVCGEARRIEVTFMDDSEKSYTKAELIALSAIDPADVCKSE